jgi:hypothetical protein
MYYVIPELFLTYYRLSIPKLISIQYSIPDPEQFPIPIIFSIPDKITPKNVPKVIPAQLYENHTYMCRVVSIIRSIDDTKIDKICWHLLAYFQFKCHAETFFSSHPLDGTRGPLEVAHAHIVDSGRK